MLKWRIMKILNLSLDSSILNKDSVAAAKTLEYASLVEKYFVILPSEEKKELALSEKTKIFGINGGHKIIQAYRIFRFADDLLKNNKFDIITAQDPFELALIGYLLAKKYKIALHIQEHGDFFSKNYWRFESPLNFFKYFLGVFILKRADGLRVVSRRIKEGLIKKLKINPDKIISVPVRTDIVENDSRRKRDALENFSGKFVFLFLGRFEKQKNLPLLVRSFQKVSAKHPKAVLFLVGAVGEKKKIIKLIAEFNLADRVIMKDWTDDIGSYYNRADAYVLSSNYEGWGRVIIEAASYSLPIIMTDVGCAGEVIRDNESGLTVPIGNQIKLEEAMIKIIEDKNLREKLGKNAREVIKNLPNKEETLKLYQESWNRALLESNKK